MSQSIGILVAAVGAVFAVVTGVIWSIKRDR